MTYYIPNTTAARALVVLWQELVKGQVPPADCDEGLLNYVAASIYAAATTAHSMQANATDMIFRRAVLHKADSDTGISPHLALQNVLAWAAALEDAPEDLGVWAHRKHVIETVMARLGISSLNEPLGAFWPTHHKGVKFIGDALNVSLDSSGADVGKRIEALLSMWQQIPSIALAVLVMRLGGNAALKETLPRLDIIDDEHRRAHFLHHLLDEAARLYAIRSWLSSVHNPRLIVSTRARAGDGFDGLRVEDIGQVIKFLHRRGKTTWLAKLPDIKGLKRLPLHALEVVVAAEILADETVLFTPDANDYAPDYDARATIVATFLERRPVPLQFEARAYRLRFVEWVWRMAAEDNTVPAPWREWAQATLADAAAATWVEGGRVSAALLERPRETLHSLVAELNEAISHEDERENAPGLKATALGYYLLQTWGSEETYGVWRAILRTLNGDDKDDAAAFLMAYLYYAFFYSEEDKIVPPMPGHSSIWDSDMTPVFSPACCPRETAEAWAYLLTRAALELRAGGDTRTIWHGALGLLLMAVPTWNTEQHQRIADFLAHLRKMIRHGGQYWNGHQGERVPATELCAAFERLLQNTASNKVFGLRAWVRELTCSQAERADAGKQTE